MHVRSCAAVAPFLAYALLAFFLPSASLSSQTADSLTSTFEVLDTVIEKSIRNLEARSPSFAASMDTIRSSGVLVVIGTPEQMAKRMKLTLDPVVGVATTFPLTSKKNPSRVKALLIVVESERMQRSYNLHHWAHAVFERDLELVLAHELFAHVHTGVVNGDVHDLCPDMPENKEESPCAVRRENIIREELDIPPRKSYLESGLGFVDINFLMLANQYRRFGLTAEQADMSLIRALHTYYRERGAGAKPE